MTNPAHDDNASLLSPLFADGRPLLTLGTLGLLLSGAFAIFLGLSNQFLPHDIQFLGMTANDLCKGRRASSPRGAAQCPCTFGRRNASAPADAFAVARAKVSIMS